MTIAVTNTSKDFREEDRRSAPVLSPESDGAVAALSGRSLTVLDVTGARCLLQTRSAEGGAGIQPSR